MNSKHVICLCKVNMFTVLNVSMFKLQDRTKIETQTRKKKAEFYSLFVNVRL